MLTGSTMRRSSRSAPKVLLIMNPDTRKRRGTGNFIMRIIPFVFIDDILKSNDEYVLQDLRYNNYHLSQDRENSCSWKKNEDFDRSERTQERGTTRSLFFSGLVSERTDPVVVYKPAKDNTSQRARPIGCRSSHSFLILVRSRIVNRKRQWGGKGTRKRRRIPPCLSQQTSYFTRSGP